MPHPTLKELVRDLEVAQQNDFDTGPDIAEEVGRRIMLKHHRLSRRGIHLNRWANDVTAHNALIDQFLLIEDFTIILKRDIDIIAHHGQVQETLAIGNTRNVISIIQEHNKIIFDNPLRTDYPRTESWSRPVCISYDYDRHLPTSRTRDKSWYRRGFNIKEAEFLVFNQAFGKIRSTDLMFLYGVFDGNIGVLSPTHTQSTRIMKLHVDRVRRNTGSGYKVQFHGYPISPNTLRADVRNDILFNRINDNEIQTT